MTRTIQWLSRGLNTAKWAEALALVTSYSLPKDAVFRTPARSAIESPRNFRDQRKKAWLSFSERPFDGYDRVPADGVDAMKRWVLGAIAEKPIGGKLLRIFAGSPKRHVFWLPRNSAGTGAVLRSEAAHLSVDIHFGERKTVASGRRRSLRPALGHLRRVHRLRWFVLDHFVYRCFTYQSKPYLPLASLSPGQRIVVALNGFSVLAASGNVRVRIHSVKQRVAIHIPVPVKSRPERHERGGIGLDACV